MMLQQISFFVRQMKPHMSKQLTHHFLIINQGFYFICKVNLSIHLLIIFDQLLHFATSFMKTQDHFLMIDASFN